MTQITLTTKEFSKKPGTANAYKLESESTEVIDSKQHNLITNEDTCKWFRRLGGSETKQMGYTSDGYKCTRLTSTSPDKSIKKIRSFSFKWID